MEITFKCVMCGHETIHTTYGPCDDPTCPECDGRMIRATDYYQPFKYTLTHKPVEAE